MLPFSITEKKEMKILFVIKILLLLTNIEYFCYVTGRYVGSRPIKLRKSSWKNRNLDIVRKKDKEKAVLIGLLTGRT